MTTPVNRLSAIAARAAAADRVAFDRTRLDVSEPWSGSVSELNLLLRAPLEHVGLDALDVFVELFDGPDKVRGLPDEVDTRPPFAPAVWFVEITDGLCIFAGEATACERLEAVIPDAARAVSAAYAAHAGLDAGAGWPAASLHEGAMALGLARML